VARGFAEAGAKVVLISRSPEKIEAAAQGLRSAGHEAAVSAADVRDFAAVDKAFAANARSIWRDRHCPVRGGRNFIALRCACRQAFKTVVDRSSWARSMVLRASFSIAPSGVTDLDHRGTGRAPDAQSGPCVRREGGVNMVISAWQ